MSLRRAVNSEGDNTAPMQADSPPNAILSADGLATRRGAVYLGDLVSVQENGGGGGRGGGSASGCKQPSQMQFCVTDIQTLVLVPSASTLSAS